MKNLFEIHQDVGISYLGEHYAVREVDEELRKKQDAINEEIGSMEQYPKMPFLFKFAKIVSFVLAFLMTSVLLKNNMDFQSVFASKSGILMLVFGIIGYIALIVLYIIEAKKNKTYRKEVIEVAQEKAVSIVDESRKALNVPDDALRVDVLYTVVSGAETDHKYFNVSMFAFCDEKWFYLANVEKVFRFDRAIIKQVLKIEESISFYGWNKFEGYKSPEYKPYGVKVKGFGFYSVPSYGRMVIHENVEDQNGEEEELIINIPNYDAKAIKDLLGL